jgi:glycosyltransferase involved in cell wall biosynthesis
MQYSIIVPLYNEEEVIHESFNRLKKVMDSTGEPYELIFVNDGSRDKTEEMAACLAKEHPEVRLISFSRNFGHQIAITAGMDAASGNAVVVIDADLQDPPEVILQMIEKWKEGYEVVYGQRLKRKGETFFKKLSAKLFYRFLKSMTSVEIPVDTGDFRLIDRKVCNAMNSLTERNRYVRGLVSWVGFRQCAVTYVRDERFAGETKYPLKKMLKFASDGITSFSYKPLKLATYAGFVMSGGGFIYLLFVIWQKIMGYASQTGWASMVAIQLFFSGITLIILGIIGEYVGRIYDECKNRPLYIVRTRLGFDEEGQNTDEKNKPGGNH